MDSQLSREVTRMLNSMANGDRRAADSLLPLVYDEFRVLANNFLKGSPRMETLQATGLVHEVYLKLVDQKKVDWRGRTHFFAVGAIIMRRLLVDHARSKMRLKRGGENTRIELRENIALSPQKSEDVLALEEALEKLEKLSPRQAKMVVMRFYGGLKILEVAEALGVSKSTVENDWKMAKAWLRRELSQNN